jgi:aspartate racemase
MKTIGLLGGMSWESTVSYYQTINRVIGAKLGGYHSAKILLYSVDFAEIEALQNQGRWSETGAILATAARGLQESGADLLALCTNTMHIVSDTIEEAIDIPFLHIADATAARIRAAGIARVGLLGTRFTMEESFYRGRLEEKYGLEVLVPERDAREVVHATIYDELIKGRVLESSREAYRDIVGNLMNAGAQGIILGCTEIGLLLRDEDASLPLFDTAQIHAVRIAHAALV